MKPEAYILCIAKRNTLSEESGRRNPGHQASVIVVGESKESAVQLYRSELEAFEQHFPVSHTQPDEFVFVRYDLPRRLGPTCSRVKPNNKFLASRTDSIRVDA